MSTRVIRHMSLGKASVVVFVVVAILTTLFMLKMSQGEALPGSATDGSAVPHYFGPYPNWAMSPLSSIDATVTINGTGTGAQAAVATVDPATGGIISIAVTSPGQNYTLNTSVTIVGGNGGAASPTVSTTGVVSGFTVADPGSGYSAFDVALSGGSPTTSATASAYGEVDAVAITDGINLA